jgi:hypothetical protein
MAASSGPVFVFFRADRFDNVWRQQRQPQHACDVGFIDLLGEAISALAGLICGLPVLNPWPYIVLAARMEATCRLKWMRK